MIWLDDISDLEFYNHHPDAECYCDLLVNADDLVLQAQIAGPGNGYYEVIVEVLSADGLTALEDATQYFKWFAFQGVDGKFYVNLEALRFAPTMCANACFILRLTVNRVTAYGDIGGGDVMLSRNQLFRKYTERYCVDSCCLIPGDIDIELGDVEGEYDALDYDSQDYFAS